ncbi:MAG: hypothetical protein ACLFQS_05545 [Bacteroidales bacterium]
MGKNYFWARFLSFILHPLILPGLGMLIIFSIDSYITFSIPEKAQNLIVLIVFVNTGLAPLLTIYFLSRSQIISNVSLNSRKDRLIPNLVSVMFYLFTLYLFMQAKLPSFVIHFMAAAVVLTFSGFIITLFWKISIHMLSIGGMIGLLLSFSLLLQKEIPLIIVLSIVLAGALGSARIVLKAHTPPQVYTGFITGFAIMFSVIMLLSN